MADSIESVLGATAGWGFIGVLFGSLFFGVSCAQTLYYLRHFQRDGWRLRLFIGCLWVLDLARTAISTACIWDFLVTDHANLLEVELLPSTFSAQYVLGGFTSSLVQLYYIRIIYVFIRDKWYRYPATVFMTTSSLLSLCASYNNDIFVSNVIDILQLSTLQLQPG